MTNTILSAMLGAAFALPAAAAAPFEVKTSTAPPADPSTIYTAEKLRDPFQAASAGSSAGRPYSLENDFNIHNLSLRGVMKDSGADYALFSDTGFGATFILRNGKLYDSRNRPVRGVSGKLRVKGKWAMLETADHDVQTFRLGEEEKE